MKLPRVVILFLLITRPVLAVAFADTSLTCDTVGQSTVTLHRGYSRVEYTLPDSVKEEFRRKLVNFKTDIYQNCNSHIDESSTVLKSVLPVDLVSVIQSMKDRNEPTALVIHNMPIDEYIPPTPQNGNKPPVKQFDKAGKEIYDNNSKGLVSEASILGVAGLLDAIPDFEDQEKDGACIHQIIPRDDPKSKAQESSFGSEIPFEPHTENVYHEPPIKYFALECLRADPKVATSIIFLDDILAFAKDNMPDGMSYEWFVEQLYKPQFSMRTGPSFENSDGVQRTLPILSITEKGERLFRLNLNKGRTVGLTPEAIKIINFFKNIFANQSFKENYITKIYLQTGDFLLFNNWEVMHARDAFKIDQDNWRWLQRCYFKINN